MPNNLKSYIIPTVLFPTLLLLTIFKMIDTDVWFHMKAGLLMAETWRFIYKDMFSYTAAGREWLYHEWLFGVISYYTYSVFGMNGLILGKAAVLTVTFFAVYKCMRIRGVNPYIAFFVLFIAVLAARFRFMERPHIFKFLFVAIFIYLLDLYRLKDKNRLWLLPILQVLWTNIHGSFILGPAITAIYLISEAISGKKRGIKGFAVILALTSLATLINPYGFKLLGFSLGFGEKQVLVAIMEWTPTGLTDLYGAFGFLFITGVVSFFLKFRKMETADALIFTLFAYLSFKAIRFTAIFSIATAPIIAGNISYLVSELKLSAFRKLTAGLLSVAVILLFGVHEFRRNPNLVFGLGPADVFPERAGDFLDRVRIKGNMYNSYVFGGYLIWRYYPERKVFFDGRAELYDKEFQNAFITGISINKWQEAVIMNNISYAVIAYPGEGLALLISSDPKWVLIYWDNVARVYVRDTLQNQEIINRYGHQIMTNPERLNHDLIKNTVNKGLEDRLEFELKTDIANSKNAKALYWLGMLYYETKREEEAVRIWEASLMIKRDATTFNSIGYALQRKGQYARAMEFYKKAIKYDEGYAIAYYNLGNVYDALGEEEKAIECYKRFIKYARSRHSKIVRELKERGIE